MAKRKQKRKHGSRAKPKHTQPNPIQPGQAHYIPPPAAHTDPRQLEELGWLVRQLREEHGLESDEEMGAFLEKLIRQNGGQVPRLPPRNSLEEAQSLFYQALEERGSRRRRLARQALEVSPDCADAYVLLAEETPDDRAAGHLYEQALAAGERVIDPERFAQEAGRFWGLLEGRPYIRALAGLSDVCWPIGKRSESVAHLQEVMRLDADDHLEVHYRLAARLLAVGDDTALRQLMDRFPDDRRASWLYSRALMLFRRHGEGRRSWRALAEALDANPYVISLMLGIQKLPRRLPETIEEGGPSEAVEYVVESIYGWENTPGAVEWLGSLLEAALTGASDDDEPGLFSSAPSSSLIRPLSNLIRPFWK